MSDIQKDYKNLVELLKKRNINDSAVEVLMWDQYAMASEFEAELRAEQIGSLNSIVHDILVDNKTGKLLDRLSNNLTLSSEQKRVIELTRKEYLEEKGVPSKLVEEYSKTCSESESAWKKAKSEKDFSIFLPYISKIIDLSREVALKRHPGKDPYESMLLNYEPDLDLKTVSDLVKKVELNVFEILKSWNAKHDSDKMSSEFLTKKVTRTKQKKFNKKIAKLVGFDFSKSRIDDGPHPCSVARRIITRYDDSWFDQFLTTMHEVGHHNYDSNTGNLFENPLNRYLSYSVHESQSRLIENHVGKSRAFWENNFEQMKKMYASALEGISLDYFIKAINQPKFSLIRVASEEITYPLHIAFRFELEQDLISGKLKPENLPDRWNEKVKELLGLTVTDDSVGCLQEDHWAEGGFGYFPTYVLGNMMAAQLYNAANNQIPSLENEISKGNLAPLLGWLKENIHQHGRRYDTQTLIKRATGKEIDATHYINHLKSKVN